MGVDLVRDGNVVHVNWQGWGKLTAIASEHGWEPMGTKAPTPDPLEVEGEVEDYVDWDGGYFSNDWQLVTAEDAANLGNALIKAQQDPEVQSMGRRFLGIIEEMIALCEGGEFLIG